MALLLLIIHEIQSPKILTIKGVLQLDKIIELDNSGPYGVFNFVFIIITLLWLFRIGI